MKKILSLSLLSLMLFVACNKKAEEKKAEEPASAEAPAATETVSDEVADAPEGCPNKTSVVVKSDETGTVNMNTANSWYIENSAGWGTFYFTNYEFNKKSPFGHEYTDTDAMAYFDINTADKSPVNIGIWGEDKTSENNTLGGLSISSISTSRSIIGDKKKVTLTYVGTDYICGSVTADDGYGSIIGEFIAKYYKWGT